MRSFLIALQFLTIIPVKLEEAVSEDKLAKSMVYFPVVGLLLGAILVIINLISSFLFPPLAAKAMVLISLVILTGALPLEGFANTCERFFLRKEGDASLAVRQESRLSSRGIICLVSLLLIKFALLYSLIERTASGALFLMPVIGRWSMVAVGAMTSYAQTDEEKSHAVDKTDYGNFIKASIITFIISLFTFRFFVIPLMIIVYLSIMVLRRLSLKKAGEISPDVLGATAELMEVFTLMLIILMIR